LPVDFSVLIKLAGIMTEEQMGTAFIIFGLFIYGIHPVVVEFGGLFLAPLFFASIATILAGSTAIPLSVHNQKKATSSITFHDYIRLILAGFFGTFLAFGCFFLGLQFTSSNNAAVILRAELVFALIFGYFFLGEVISPKQAALMILILCGVFLVIITTQVFTFGYGDILLLITPVAWAAGHTCAKPILNHVPLWTVVTFRNLVGGGLLLLMTTIMIFLGGPLVLIPNLTVIIGILVIEVLVILLGHGLWYAGIRRINLGKATALIAGAPIVTFLLSTFVLLVPPTLWQLIGAIIVIATTILLSREVSLKRPPKSEMPFA
jgi:drug/metabolite transporter (DMT)-like permease